MDVQKYDLSNEEVHELILQNQKLTEENALLTKTIADHELLITSYEEMNRHNQQKILYIELMLQTHTHHTVQLKEAVTNLKITFKNDIFHGLKLLKREGIGMFCKRLMWYMRGKRLVEDIEKATSVSH